MNNSAWVQLEQKLLQGYDPHQPISIAIGEFRPNGRALTEKEMEEMRQAMNAPFPADDEDDFVDDPPSKPWDPENSLYEWAKPEAWVEEQDSEGRTIWRNRISGLQMTSRPGILPDLIVNGTTTKQDKKSPSSVAGPLEYPEK